MVGQTILHYQILRKLGAGGMGEVYKAQDTHLNRFVAIKVLSREKAGDQERRRRFIQEAQAASSLNHPNIITIHDIVSQGTDEFMVMEFVNGKTLTELIPNNGLSVATTLQYAVQIAAGLEAAHTVGIIHRDLKPDNIMVTENGLVKVLDFGLAKLTAVNDFVSLTDETATAGPLPMTVEGSILGTVSYMSPEQAQGKNVDARSEVFSFGTVIYEMLTGRKAFTSDSPLLTLSAILRDDPAPVSQIVPGVPRELDLAIQQALRKDPNQRWQSMKELHDILLALKLKSDSGILAVPPMVVGKNSSPVIALVSIVLLAGLASGWWWWTRRHVPGPAGIPTTSLSKTTPASGKGSAEVKPSALSGVILTNQGVIEMAKANVPAAVIIGHIRSSTTNFDLSTASVIALAQAGVPEAVIAAMRDPTGARGSPLPATAGNDGIDQSTPRTVQVTGGTPFEITLVEDIPTDVVPGQPLRFRATQGVSVGDAVIVPKGAPVTGAVTEVGKKKLFIHTGKTTFRLIDVTAEGGSKLKVRATPGGAGGGRKDPVLEAAGAPRSKAVLVPAGSRFFAYFDGDQTLTLQR